MAKDFSSSQKKIVDRYYEHRDTIMLDRLGQIVSDIYLAESPAKLDKLWQSAAGALEKVGANPAASRKVIADKNVEALARLIGELTVGDSKKPTTATGTSTSTPAAIPTLAKPAITTQAASPASVEAAGDAGADASDGEGPSAQDLKMALKAFRKRLKLTKLDEESRVGRSPLSSGQKSNVVAIEAPRQYPLAVWEALADQGKLKRAGRGFYQLAPDA